MELPVHVRAKLLDLQRDILPRQDVVQVGDVEHEALQVHGDRDLAPDAERRRRGGQDHHLEIRAR